MGNDDVRFVLLGAGSIAGKYVTAVNNVPGASIVAVVSRTSEKAEQFAQKNGLDHFSDSLETLAETVDFDAVIIRQSPWGKYMSNLSAAQVQSQA